MWLHVAGELLLTTSCAWAVVAALRHRSVLAALGFALIGIAALLGALNYAGVPDTAAPHDTATFLAARLGLLMVAAKALIDMRRALFIALACAVALLVPETAALAVSALALVAICWKGRSVRWPLAIVGAALFALAGLIIGTRGEWLQIPRVDLYHFTLAIAILVWIAAGVAVKARRA